jgi:hypothetical protein
LSRTAAPPPLWGERQWWIQFERQPWSSSSSTSVQATSHLYNSKFRRRPHCAAVALDANVHRLQDLLPAYQLSTPPRTDPSVTQLTTDARLLVLCRHRLTPPLRQPSSLLSPPPQRLLHSTNWWARQKLTGMTLLRSWSGLGNDGGRANMRSRGLHFRVPNRYGRILRNCWTKFFSLFFSL